MNALRLALLSLSALPASAAMRGAVPARSNASPVSAASASISAPVSNARSAPASAVLDSGINPEVLRALRPSPEELAVIVPQLEKAIDSQAAIVAAELASGARSIENASVEVAKFRILGTMMGDGVARAASRAESLVAAEAGRRGLTLAQGAGFESRSPEDAPSAVADGKTSVPGRLAPSTPREVPSAAPVEAPRSYEFGVRSRHALLLRHAAGDLATWAAALFGVGVVLILHAVTGFGLWLVSLSPLLAVLSLVAFAMGDPSRSRTRGHHGPAQLSVRERTARGFAATGSVAIAASVNAAAGLLGAPVALALIAGGLAAGLSLLWSMRVLAEGERGAVYGFHWGLIVGAAAYVLADLLTAGTALASFNGVALIAAFAAALAAGVQISHRVNGTASPS